MADLDLRSDWPIVPECSPRPGIRFDGTGPDARRVVEGRGFDAVIADLPPVTLAEVEPVSLLGRFDRKFLLDEAQLLQLVAGFGSDGRVLEVGGERSTPYSTMYFDTPDRMTYRAHTQGRRNRFKVRTRHYGDPSAAMLEVKVKGLRGRTAKHRCAHPGPDPLVLGEASFGFIAAVLDEAYAVEPPADLAPSLLTSFRRTTLADLTRGIRVTIDRNLNVADPTLAEQVALGDGLAIVEVKSPVLPSPVERVLLSAGARPHRLSKYCLGVVALHPAIPGNRWRPQLRRVFPAAGRPDPRVCLDGDHGDAQPGGPSDDRPSGAGPSRAHAPFS